MKRTQIGNTLESHPYSITGDWRIYYTLYYAGKRINRYTSVPSAKSAALRDVKKRKEQP